MILASWNKNYICTNKYKMLDGLTWMLCNVLSSKTNGWIDINPFRIVGIPLPSLFFILYLLGSALFS